MNRKTEITAAAMLGALGASQALAVKAPHELCGEARLRMCDTKLAQPKEAPGNPLSTRQNVTAAVASVTTTDVIQFTVGDSHATFNPPNLLTVFRLV